MNIDGNALLIVEDDEGIQKQLKWCFDQHEILISNNRQDAITLLRRHQPGVVLLDLGLPPDPGGVTEGFATLKEILSLAPETKVIVVTGDNDRQNAIRAIGNGAYDFYQKPVESEILSLIVERAYHVHGLEQENKNLLNNQLQTPIKNIITASPEMLKVCRTIEKVAPTDITTLLLGASGTGKELVAQALHQLSSRSAQKMIAINCAAIPETLLESELFGYEKGAFTGAHKQTPGKIEYANGSTLFLDEIGDLPLELQSKLLRFLQERVIERVGGRTEIEIDARIICATHQNLAKLIEEGKFREDLYYRISEITIEIPSLKARQGDALVLAKFFLARFNEELGKSIKGFDDEAIRAIEHHAWPGNVRELESKVKRAMVMADKNIVTLEDLGLPGNSTDSLPINLKQVRDDAERQAILRALTICDNNISETAKLLGVTRPTLYALLEKNGIR
jgi:two-component system NtrC family response regulator